MSKHTEYPSIPVLKPEADFNPASAQEKLDGANIRVIISKSGEVTLGTRKVILSDGVRDFKNFRRDFESILIRLALENLKPRVDALRLVYDEIVAHGELVGPTVFDRLKYNIDGLEVFFYDVSVFRNGEKVTLPWGFGEIQNVLRECGFRTIPYRPFTPELLTRIDRERSFLNPDEHIEGFVLRDVSGRGIYKCKSSYFKSVEFGKGKRGALKPTKNMYENVRDKFGHIEALPTEERLTLLMEEMISNYSALKLKEPSKEWIKNNRKKCVKKFFPREINNDPTRPVIEVSYQAKFKRI